MKKGQVSIEFIILIMIMLLYVQLIIKPTINISRGAVDEVQRLAESKIAAQKISNAVSFVGSAGIESRRTVSFSLPAGASVSCSGKAITYSARISEEIGGVGACETDGDNDDFLCTASAKLRAPSGVNCQQANFSGPGNFEAVIEKKAGEIIVSKGPGLN